MVATDGETGRGYDERNASYATYVTKVMTAHMLEVSWRVGTVLRLERDAWSMVKLLRQATNEPPPAHSCRLKNLSGVSNFRLKVTSGGGDSSLLPGKRSESMKSEGTYSMASDAADRRRWSRWGGDSNNQHS